MVGFGELSPIDLLLRILKVMQAMDSLGRYNVSFVSNLLNTKAEMFCIKCVTEGLEHR
jgi:hypothetical protein